MLYYCSRLRVLVFGRLTTPGAPTTSAVGQTHRASCTDGRRGRQHGKYSPGAALRNRYVKKSGPQNKLSRLKEKGRRRAARRRRRAAAGEKRPHPPDPAKKSGPLRIPVFLLPRQDRRLLLLLLLLLLLFLFVCLLICLFGCFLLLLPLKI